MVLSVQHLTPQNLLEKLDLNPAWENWRGYCYLGTVIATIMAIYQTLKGLDVHCVPDPGMNNSLIPELSEAATAYLNTMCSASKNLYSVKYSGLIMLTCDVAILFASSFWLHVPRVAAPLNAFVEARKKLQESNYARDEVRRICENILEDHTANRDDKEREFIKGASSIYSIYRGMGSDWVFRWYIIQVTMNASVLSFSAYCSIYYSLILNSLSTQRFSCQLNQADSFLDRETASVFNARCAANDAKMILRLFIVFSFFVFLQLIFIICGLVNILCGVCCRARGSKTFLLLMKFEKSVRPWVMEMLQDVLHHLVLVQTKFKRTLDEDIPRVTNLDKLRRYVKIFGPIPEVIDLLQKNFSTCRYYIKRYLKTLEAIEYSLDDEQVVSFLKHLEKHRHWQILVNVIENSTSKQKNVDHPDIPPVSLTDLPEDGEKHSVLYYAFAEEYSTGPVKFVAAKLLCKGKKLDELKVFERGQEMALKSYLEKSYSRDEFNNILQEMNWTDETSNQSSWWRSILLNCCSRRSTSDASGETTPLLHSNAQ